MEKKRSDDCNLRELLKIDDTVILVVLKERVLMQLHQIPHPKKLDEIDSDMISQIKYFFRTELSDRFSANAFREWFVFSWPCDVESGGCGSGQRAGHLMSKADFKYRCVSPAYTVRLIRWSLTLRPLQEATFLSSLISPQNRNKEIGDIH